MRRLVAILAALALAGTLAFPSVAAPLSNLDPVSNHVVLTPSDGPNGNYSYLDADDELVVDLSASNPDVAGEGVNANGITGIDDVFKIRYNGSRFAYVWLTHGSDQITFYANGRPIQSEANNVTLGPNQSASVGVRVDTTGETPDGLIDDITIHARVAEPEDVESGSAASESGGQTTNGVSLQSAGGQDAGLNIRYFEPAAGVRKFTVTNAPAGELVSLDPRGFPLDRADGGTLMLDRLSVTPARGGMTVEVRAKRATALDGLASNAGIEPLGAIAVETGGGENEARVRFSVAPAYLDAVGVSPEQLTIYRNAGSGWNALDTRHVGKRGGRHALVARPPGFSTIAVAADTGASTTDSGRASIEADGPATATVSAPDGQQSEGDAPAPAASEESGSAADSGPSAKTEAAGAEAGAPTEWPLDRKTLGVLGVSLLGALAVAVRRRTRK